MDFWEIEFRGSYPFSSSAGLPLNSLFTQKSIIICSARMRCKDNEISREIIFLAKKLLVSKIIPIFALSL